MKQKSIRLFDISPIIVLILLVTSLWLQTTPQDAGNRSQQQLRTGVDIKIGGMSESGLVRRYGGEVEDPALIERIDGIFVPVADEAKRERDDLEYEITVLASGESNAFALPGGHTYITQGLVDILATDDEIAGVLAHELAHTVKSHGTKALGRRIGMVTLANVLMDQVEPGAGKQSSEAIKTGVNLLGLSFSREEEQAADLIGQKWAVAAGFDPLGLASALQKIQAAQNSDGEQPMEFLSTHPLTERRVEELYKNAEDLGYDVPAIDPVRKALEAYVQESQDSSPPEKTTP